MRCYALGFENNTNRGLGSVKTHNIGTNGESLPRRPLTASEIEAKKRLAEERRRKSDEQRKSKRETRVVCLLFGACVYLAVCILIAVYVVVLYFGGGEEEYTELEIIDADGEVAYTQSDDAFLINDVPYVSATALGKLYDFTLAGDKSQVTLHFHNIGQSLSLYKDSSVVVVNGERTRLNAPIIFRDDYYIPLELIKNYFLGAIIEYDGEDGKVMLSRQAGEDGFSLRLHAPEMTALPEIE